MKKHDSIEFLEPRIAPASLITFTDVDGDFVTVKSTKGVLTTDPNHADLPGYVKLVDLGGGKSKLVEIFLNDPTFSKTNLIITAKKVKGGSGDGLVNVGYINAAGVDLGTVKVPGDIGRIDAGDGNAAKPAIKVLQARSLGAFGTATQDPTANPTGGPDPGLVQILLDPLLGDPKDLTDGTLGSLLTTVNNLLGAGGLSDSLQRSLSAVKGVLDNLVNLDTTSIGDAIAPAKSLLATLSTELGKITSLDPNDIPGSLSGVLPTVKTAVNDALTAVTQGDGLTGTPGNILSGILGSVDKLKELLNGPISTQVPQNLLTSLTGSEGTLNGLINLLPLGSLKTLLTNVSNGTDQLVSDAAGGNLQTVLSDVNSLQTSVQNALAANPDTTTTNTLNAIQDTLTQILGLPQSRLSGLEDTVNTVLDALSNPSNLPSQLPDGVQSLVNNIVGQLQGVHDVIDPILNSGGVLDPSALGDLAQVQTELTSLVGAIGGSLSSGVLDQVNGLLNSVGDTMGSGDNAGSGSDPAMLKSNILGDVGLLKISKDVSNVFVNVVGNVKNLQISGTLIGGSAQNSGEIYATGNIQVLKVGKGIMGGLDLNTGLIQSDGFMKSANIGGSIIGGVGNSSGELLVKGDLTSVKVKGDLLGNTGLFAGSIESSLGRIATLGIKGSVVSGQNTDSGTIRVANDINNLTIGGNLIGDADNSVVLSAAAKVSNSHKTDYAFKTLKVGGRVAYADILGGYDTDLSPVNAHAQMGTVIVGGDWVASNLIAGATGNGGNYGTADDAAIANSIAGSVISKIASVQIKGAIRGTDADSTDHYGFVAQEIGKFRVGTNKLQLNKDGGNDAVVFGQATGNDVLLHELGAPVI